MGRVRRMDVGGMVYHALNRANFRSALFKDGGHYQDFLDLVEESLDFVSMRILAPLRKGRAKETSEPLAPGGTARLFALAEPIATEGAD